MATLGKVGGVESGGRGARRDGMSWLQNLFGMQEDLTVVAVESKPSQATGDASATPAPTAGHSAGAEPPSAVAGPSTAEQQQPAPPPPPPKPSKTSPPYPPPPLPPAKAEPEPEPEPALESEMRPPQTAFASPPPPPPSAAAEPEPTSAPAPGPESLAGTSASPAPLLEGADVALPKLPAGDAALPRAPSAASMRHTPTVMAIEQFARASALSTALTDAEAALAAANQQLSVMEDEWSAKEAQIMQRNSSLRIEARQSDRRGKAAERALQAARERIVELEQALTDAALRSDDTADDVSAAAAGSGNSGGNSVVSLGEGHGGIDLGNASARHASSGPRRRRPRPPRVRPRRTSTSSRG